MLPWFLCYSTQAGIDYYVEPGPLGQRCDVRYSLQIICLYILGNSSKGTMVPTGEAWCENGGRRKPFYEQDP